MVARRPSRRAGSRSRAGRRRAGSARPRTWRRSCGRPRWRRRRAASAPAPAARRTPPGGRRCRSGRAPRRTAPGLQGRRQPLHGGVDLRPRRGHRIAILEPVTVLRHERPPARAEVDVVVVGAGGAGMSAALAVREAGSGHRRCSRRALLRRLDRPQRRRGLDPRQLRPQGGRPGSDGHRRVQALPRLDRRRRRPEGPPRHLPRPRPRGAWTSSATHSAALRVGARTTPTTTRRRPAAGSAGRTCEPVPMDARFLGDELERLHPQYTKAPANMIVTQADFRKISLGLRTLRGPLTMVKVLVRRIAQPAAAPQDVRDGQRHRDRPAQGAGRRRRPGRLRGRAHRPGARGRPRRRRRGRARRRRARRPRPTRCGPRQRRLRAEPRDAREVPAAPDLGRLDDRLAVQHRRRHPRRHRRRRRDRPDGRLLVGPDDPAAERARGSAWPSATCPARSSSTRPASGT